MLCMVYFKHAKRRNCSEKRNTFWPGQKNSVHYSCRLSLTFTINHNQNVIIEHNLPVSKLDCAQTFHLLQCDITNDDIQNLYLYVMHITKINHFKVGSTLRNDKTFIFLALCFIKVFINIPEYIIFY